MAKSLRKYKFTGGTETAGPKASGSSVSPNEGAGGSPQSEDNMEAADLKVEILSELKKDIAVLLRSELKAVLAEEFASVKAEINAVKAEVANNTATMRSEVETMKTSITEMERGLSTFSDDVVSLQTRVGRLEAEVTGLRGKCLDMEGRMRRSNIRILNIPETPGSSSPVAVAKLLKDVLNTEKDILIDRSHRGLQAKKPDGKPRVIVAKVHYFQDCVEILRRARESGPLYFNGATISIFPDYPPSVAQARSAFSEVKRLLRGRDGIRYGLSYPA